MNDDLRIPVAPATPIEVANLADAAPMVATFEVSRWSATPPRLALLGMRYDQRRPWRR